MTGQENKASDKTQNHVPKSIFQLKQPRPFYHKKFLQSCVLLLQHSLIDLISLAFYGAAVDSWDKLMTHIRKSPLSDTHLSGGTVKLQQKLNVSL